MDKALEEIVKAALQLGAIDILTVLTWVQNGTPGDEIVAEIKAKLQGRRLEFVS